MSVTAAALGQMQRQRYPLTESMIVAAMQQRKLPVAGVEVRLAAPITASVAEPAIQIQGMTMSDRRTARLKVACRNGAECLPFFVTAVWPKQVDLASQHVALGPEEGSSSLRTTNVVDDSDTLRAGKPATLMIDDSRIHIRLTVVSLETGTPGEKIRVTTPDHRQFFVAEVLNGHLLKGNFQ